MTLKERLDILYTRYNGEYLMTDPVQFVHRYSDPLDREIAAFFSAGLAFGTVKQICGSVEKLLTIMGPSPGEYVNNFSRDTASADFESFYHRWIRGRDVVMALGYLHAVVKQSGTLGRHFLQFYRPDDPTLAVAIQGFAENAGAYEKREKPVNADGAAGSLHYFFPSPAGKSACKRLNLFLRWMVRREDGVDLGLWREIDPAQLIMPVDTHIGRIARFVGLTAYRNPSFAMALDITDRLREFNRTDPVKYDFALARLGILNRCLGYRDEKTCPDCELQPWCVEWNKKP